MSYLTDNVIPGDHGKVFSTDAKNPQDLESIANTIKTIDGIKDVILNDEESVKEFIVHTSKMVEISKIEHAVKALGFHIIPKSLFHL